MALLLAVAAAAAALAGRRARRLQDGHVEPEWGGIFDLSAGTYKWVFCKTGSPAAYAAADVAFWAGATDNERVTTTLKNYAEEEFESFSGSHTGAPATLTPETVYVLEMNAGQDCTEFSVAISAASHYVIFMQHAPGEFEGSSGHYLKDPGGADVEAVAEWSVSAGHTVRDAHAGHDHGGGGAVDAGSSLSKGERWGYSILASFITGMMIFFGAIVWLVCEKAGMSEDARSNVRVLLRGFASGVLSSVVFIHLFLEIYEGTHYGLKFNWKPLCTVVAGTYVGMMLLLLPEHGGHAPETAKSPAPAPAAGPTSVERRATADVERDKAEKDKALTSPRRNPLHGTDSEAGTKLSGNRSLGYLVSMGDLTCNFLDGVVIGSAFWSCSSELGWKIMGAVIAHELPGECADFSVMVASGFPVWWALVSNAVSASFAVLGAVFVCGMNEEYSQKTNVYFIAFGAGMLIVAAVANFVSVVASGKAGRSPLMFLAIAAATAAGAVIMTAFVAAFHEHCIPAGEDHSGHDH